VSEPTSWTVTHIGEALQSMSKWTTFWPLGRRPLDPFSLPKNERSDPDNWLVVPHPYVKEDPLPGGFAGFAGFVGDRVGNSKNADAQEHLESSTLANPQELAILSSIRQMLRSSRKTLRKVFKSEQEWQEASTSVGEPRFQVVALYSQLTSLLLEAAQLPSGWTSHASSSRAYALSRAVEKLLQLQDAAYRLEMAMRATRPRPRTEKEREATVDRLADFAREVGYPGKGKYKAFVIGASEKFEVKQAHIRKAIPEIKERLLRP